MMPSLFLHSPAHDPNVPGGTYDWVINDNMIAGLAMVAWPADYGASGAMAVNVNQRGVVVQKDLGPTNSKPGPWTQTYNPDASWTPVAKD
jgi:hypothetical protein